MSACHPQVRQREQRHQLRSILGQATEARLHITELPLDHPKRVLNLGPYLSLGFLDLASGFVQRAALAQLFVSAAPCCHLPNHFAAIMLGTLLDAGITRIGADHVFLAMQQLVDLGDVRHVSRRTYHAMHQARFVIDADVGLQSGKTGVLPPLSPLRTVRESHPSYGSSLPAA